MKSLCSVLHLGLKVHIEGLPAKKGSRQPIPLNIIYKLSFGGKRLRILDNIEDFLFSLQRIKVDYWLIPSEPILPTANTED